jgi:hypothetical protein
MALPGSEFFTELRVVCVVPSKEYGLQLEEKLIQRLRSRGANLVNGTHDVPPERREAIRRSLFGRPSPKLGTELSQEVKDKISASLTGKVQSEATRNARRISMIQTLALKRQR